MAFRNLLVRIITITIFFSNDSSYKELSLKFGLKQLLLKVQHGLACFVVMQHKALHMYKSGQM